MPMRHVDYLKLFELALEGCRHRCEQGNDMTGLIFGHHVICVESGWTEALESRDSKIC